MLRIGDRIQGVELVGLIRNSARLLRKVKVINLNPGTELIAINNGVCAGSTVINDAAFAGFSVEVQCSPTTHIEGDPATGTIVTYRLTAIARSGVYGSLDQVQRHLQATVSLDPP